MRSALLLSLTLGALTLTLPVNPQNQPQQPAVRIPDGGQSGRMESIFIRPKAGAPFSFTLYTEWARPLGNGGTITFTNQRRIVRDSKGRIYQERASLVPKDGQVKTFVSTIQITDPEQHTWYNCITSTKVCDIYKYKLSTTDNFQPAIGPTVTWSGGSRQHEDLGVSSTLGEDTHGYRETTIVNPGVTGNDQPLVSKREFWYSPRLALNLLSIVDNPMSGHQVFTARELTTSEPDPAIFEVPEGYKTENHLEDDE
jgi:hypothetical protein